MKPGLVLPQFYATDVIDSSKIDQQILLMAQQVNGGLGAENLAPTYKLANAQFVERCSMFEIGAAIADAPTNTELIVGSLQTASYLVGISYLIKAESVSSSNLTIKVGGTVRFTIPIDVTMKFTIPSGRPAEGTWYVGQRTYETATTIASGSVITAVWNLGVAMCGRVSLFMATEHVA